MSEVLAKLEKKGSSGETETLLWSNSAPTNSFSGQTITLSDSIENYKYIKIVNRLNTTNATESSALYDITTFKTFGNTTNTPIGLVGFHTTSTAYGNLRKYFYASNTQITISNGLPIASTGSNNSYTIPLAIYGIK